MVTTPVPYDIPASYEHNEEGNFLTRTHRHPTDPRVDRPVGLWPAERDRNHLFGTDDVLGGNRA